MAAALALKRRTRHDGKSRGKKPSGNHAFDRECAKLEIQHRLSPPRHPPQTNGMVERFNGRISDILATTHFRSGEELQTALARYATLYDEHLPQRARGHRTPWQAVRQWKHDHPQLFKSRLPINNHTGLDT